MKNREKCFRVAICDDDLRFCEQLKTYIEQFGKEYMIDFYIDIFYSGKNLCRELQQHEEYDIIFLDIVLGDTSGIDVGNYIRDELQNQNVQIVYISAYSSYAMQLFKIRPMDFLIKPVSKSEVEHLLQVGLEILGNRRKTFLYKVKREVKEIYIADILYFKGKDREIEIVLKDKKICYYGKLRDVYEQLEDEGFVFIHKSYLINIRQILDFSYDKVSMSNGEVLEIAQGRRKRFREIQMRY